MSRGAVVLTRPEADSLRTARDLGDIPALIWPLTRIELVPVEVPSAEVLAFTSRHGVAGYVAAGGDTGLPAFCVGAATRKAAEEAGFGPCRDGGGDAESLAATIAGSGCRSVLYARGEHVTSDLAAMLGPRGIRVAEVVVYRAPETGAPPAEVRAALEAGTDVLLTVWSARAAAILARALASRSAPPALAISEAVAAPLREAGFPRVVVAPGADYGSMLAAIRGFFAAVQHSPPKSVV